LNPLNPPPNQAQKKAPPIKHVLKPGQLIQDEVKDQRKDSDDESSKEDGDREFANQEMSGYQPEADDKQKRSHKKGASGQSKKVLKQSKANTVSQNLLKIP
jgi:hypothetical protein